MEKLRVQISLDLTMINWLDKMQDRLFSHNTSETVLKIFKEYQKQLALLDQQETDRIITQTKKARILK